MFNKLKEYAGLIAVVLLVIGFFLPSGTVQRLGTATGSFYDAALGFRVNGTEVVSSGAVVDGSVSSSAVTANTLTSNTSLVVGSGGTAQSKFFCATSSWNPGSVGTTSVNAAVTSTDIALTGAVMGDRCSGSLTSATTSAAKISCGITGTATGTLFFENVGSGALDLATGTAQVCYTH